MAEKQIRVDDDTVTVAVDGSKDHIKCAFNLMSALLKGNDYPEKQSL